MHIHSSPLTNQMALAPTQGAQQTIATRKAAAEVRRKLATFASTQGEEAVSRVDAHTDADPNRKKNPQRDDESFRSVFFSASA